MADYETIQQWIHAKEIAESEGLVLSAGLILTRKQDKQGLGTFQTVAEALNYLFGYCSGRRQGRVDNLDANERSPK